MDRIRLEQQLVAEFAKLQHANLENISGLIILALYVLRQFRWTKED